MELNKPVQNRPNFTVILPGGCNAKCDFCFWKPSKINSQYIDRLEQYFSLIPCDLLTQCSISGGEPTHSVFLKPALDIISQYGFQKVVLTTNGSNLLNIISDIEGKVNFVNISRHSISDVENREIFGTTDVPDKNELINICQKLNGIGIQVNINCVVPDTFCDKQYVYDYISFCKEIGASSLTFRKDYNSETGVEASHIEKEFGNIKSVVSSRCPVCRLETKIINGFEVRFKSSVEEPSEDLDFIYEFIYQPDGLMYEDWNFKKPIGWKNKAYKSEKLSYTKRYNGYSSCGSSYHACGSDTRTNINYGSCGSGC